MYSLEENVTGPSQGLLQHVIGLYVVSTSLVSDCGGNGDRRLFLRQTLVLKILGFDDEENVTHSWQYLAWNEEIWGLRKNLLVCYIRYNLTAVRL